MSSGLEEKYKNQIVHFKKDETIFREKDISTDLYIILAGQVKIFSNKGDVIIPLNIANSGTVFGELSFFDGKQRSATALAATDVKLIKISRESSSSEMEKIPTWLMPVIHTIIAHIRQTDEIIKRNQVIDSHLNSQFEGLNHKI